MTIHYVREDSVPLETDNQVSSDLSEYDFSSMGNGAVPTEIGYEYVGAYYVKDVCTTGETAEENGIQVNSIKRETRREKYTAGTWKKPNYQYRNYYTWKYYVNSSNDGKEVENGAHIYVVYRLKSEEAEQIEPEISINKKAEKNKMVLMT